MSRAEVTTIINIPSDPPPVSVDSHTQVNVFEGGLLDSYFGLGEIDGSTENIELNVLGGFVGYGLHAYSGSTVNLIEGWIDGNARIHSGSVVNISGGSLGSTASAMTGAVVNVTGGFVGRDFEAQDGSTVNISGGTIQRWFSARDGSQVNLSGGSFGIIEAWSGSEINVSGSALLDDFSVYSGSVVNISGGTIGGNFSIGQTGKVIVSGGTIGGRISARAAKELSFTGHDFRINNIPIAGLENLGDAATTFISDDALFTGVYTDGTPFVYSRFGSAPEHDLGSINLVATSVPAIPTTPIVASREIVPLGIREGQALIVDNGASVADYFTAARGSRVEVLEGGNIGSLFKAVGSDVTVNGGTIGAGFKIYDGSTVNLNSGSLQGHAIAYAGSTVYVRGGYVGRTFQSLHGSKVYVSGGNISDMRLRESETVISGGIVEFLGHRDSGLTISGGVIGHTLNLDVRSQVTLQGNDFLINGLPLDEFDDGRKSASFAVPPDAIISGTLADGTPFAYYSLDANTKSRTGRRDSVELTLQKVDLPPIGPLLLSSSSGGSPLGIRQGQRLHADAGTEIPANFRAGRGSSLVIEPGATVGSDLQVVNSFVDASGAAIGDGFQAYNASHVIMKNTDLGDKAVIDGSSVSIEGGSVRYNLKARRGSTVSIVDASVGEGLQVSDSEVNISGGSIGPSFSLFSSTLNVSEGTVGESIGLYDGSTATISGGEFRRSFSVYEDSKLNISGGDFSGVLNVDRDSEVHLFGTEFYLDGVDLSDSLEQNKPFPLLRPSGALTGTLADGSPFRFDLTNNQFVAWELLLDYFDRDATMTITLVPEPAGFLLMISAVGILPVTYRGRHGSPRCA
ncbi:MAG: hypothetical protein AAGD11_10695 [Planctomycetota bacterium]